MNTSPCKAAVEWDKESLKPVYNPEGEFYCYAPALIRENGQDIVLACQNARPGVIRDELILLRPGADGSATTRSILAGGAGSAWDSFHVCDPSVVSGSFGFRGDKYAHALFYLGNDADASINNQVGVAFSNTWEGPWHRLPNPLVASAPGGGWGVGQPSAVYDGQGRLLLFYTKEIPWTYGYVREIDLRDADEPRPGAEHPLPAGGVRTTSGRADYWNNFDVAYDSSRDRFLAIRERHPYPRDEPNHISDSLEILSIRAASLFKPDAAWQVEGRLSPAVTGHPRNHNACLERTARGALPTPGRIRVLFSTGCAGAGCRGKNPLWTYDLWEISGSVVPAEPEPSR
ncbi:MAG: hypothetical protein ACR2IE_04025 [Candidatus Sumerlaeaceae bacterium]